MRILTHQEFIRDPGGNEPVRMLYYTNLVDGSVLTVPPDTVAIFTCNGEISEPYRHGRYEIRTGVSPFFVRLRNFMTAGDPGTSVRVWYVNVRKENMFTGGTGDMVFCERRFNVSMNARASFSLRYVITDPLALIKQLEGMHIISCNHDDLQTALESILLPTVKQEIMDYLSGHSIYEFQSGLSHISLNIRESVQTELSFYGVYPVAVVVTAVNIDPSDFKRLNELEGQLAKGRINTDIEVDNINRVYGNLERRTLTEVATGSVRGQASTVRNHGSETVGMAGMVAALPVQLAIANKVMSAMSGPLTDMMDTERTSGRTGEETTGNSSTSTRNPDTHRRTDPPDLPPQSFECPSCHRRIDESDEFCRYCGHRINS